MTTVAVRVEKYFIYDDGYDTYPRECIEKRTYGSGYSRWFIHQSRWFQVEEWSIYRWREAGILYKDNDETRDLIRRKGVDSFLRYLDSTNSFI